VLVRRRRLDRAVSQDGILSPWVMRFSTRFRRTGVDRVDRVDRGHRGAWQAPPMSR
jgi:hypothetical protein